MKKHRFGIFGRIYMFLFVVIATLGLLFITITYLATNHFYNASTQLLNKDVAAHIAKFTSPFEGGHVNKQKADSIFYNAMVISPSIEVYFLDTTGRVLYYQSPDSTILLWKLPLKNIDRFIKSAGTQYLTNPDPKQPNSNKVFSAAEVQDNSKKLGYIYVILGSKQYSNVTELIFGSHAGSLMIKVFCISVLLSILLSLFYLARLHKNYKNVITKLEQYQEGKFDVRFQKGTYNEYAPITESFNRMADIISDNMARIKKAETDRKNFIATISHDLRTPLSIAQGYTETLLTEMDKRSTEMQNEVTYARIIHKKITQVENMTTQLFELSKIESPGYKLHREPFIFSEVLEEIVSSYQTTASQKQIILKCTGCQNIGWVNADIQLMERVVQNFMDNAIKYTPEQSEIEIHLEQNESAFTVSFFNSSKPLPAEMVKWLNDNTHDQNSIAHPTANGGLGLSIVWKILSLHHYPLKVVTSESGNCFIFHMARVSPV